MKLFHYGHYFYWKNVILANKSQYNTISDKELFNRKKLIEKHKFHYFYLDGWFATHYRKIIETSCEWCQWNFWCWKYWMFNIVIILFLRDGRCPISGDLSVTYYPDKFADREIGQLIVICRNKVNGCTWSDRFKFLDVSFFWFRNFGNGHARHGSISYVKNIFVLCNKYIRAKPAKQVIVVYTTVLVAFW